MNYSSKLIPWLFGERLSKKSADDDDYRAPFFKDADRIIFSDPFRRLAQKTQVHPLYEDDHIHTRLTHSIEVAQVGASLSRKVSELLSLDDGTKRALEGSVKAACLAHDIGNPPFGHSGEYAIQSFFRTYFECSPKLVDCHTRDDLTCFEGNAQGFRLLTALEMYGPEKFGMDLSVATLGAFVKYPDGREHEMNFLNANGTVKKGKYGYFRSEKENFEKLFELLNSPKNGLDKGKNSRSPLVYLVEAADDICYKIIDIEDGFRSGDISECTAKKLLKSFYDTECNSDSISYSRSRAIGSCVEACATVFKENVDDILSGNFGLKSLYEESESIKEARNNVNDITKQIVLRGDRKTRLEVQGRNIIHTILSHIIKALEVLKDCKWNFGKIDSYNKQLLLYAGYKEIETGPDNAGNSKQLKYCNVVISDDVTALRSAADFVSGMTDRYAMNFASTLGG